MLGLCEVEPPPLLQLRKKALKKNTCTTYNRFHIIKNRKKLRWEWFRETSGDFREFMFNLEHFGIQSQLILVKVELVLEIFHIRRLFNK